MTTTEKPKTVSPRMLFRSFAIAEMFTWAGLITALILRAFDIVTLSRSPEVSTDTSSCAIQRAQSSYG